MIKSNKKNIKNRVVSAMRVTGRMHLGNYHGALKKWIELQHKYDCFFFAADWHGLTTNYEHSKSIYKQSILMIQDWLSAGLDPNLCKIFIQSNIPEHAELHLLLSMITPMSWLERIPTYKDQQNKLKEKTLNTYGFLGYPLLQSADVLAYNANLVPVGEDQVVHLELTRKIARRFNFLYGKRSKNSVSRIDSILQNLDKKQSILLKKILKSYKETGNKKVLEYGYSLINRSSSNLAIDEFKYLYKILKEREEIILHEPEVLLTEVSKFPGLDGQKMSKSYNNTITLTEDPKSVISKLKRMPTDPARIKRTDPGNPEKCPVWDWHKIYSNTDIKNYINHCCITAKIGCLDCKQYLINSVLAEQKPIIERSKKYQDNTLVNKIIKTGTRKAREIAKLTLTKVRNAIFKNF